MCHARRQVGGSCFDKLEHSVWESEHGKKERRETRSVESVHSYPGRYNSERESVYRIPYRQIKRGINEKLQKYLDS